MSTSSTIQDISGSWYMMATTKEHGEYQYLSDLVRRGIADAMVDKLLAKFWLVDNVVYLLRDDNV
jgi:hypothetical protein